jgi:hypothetical protein
MPAGRLHRVTTDESGEGDIKIVFGWLVSLGEPE